MGEVFRLFFWLLANTIALLSFLIMIWELAVADFLGSGPLVSEAVRQIMGGWFASLSLLTVSLSIYFEKQDRQPPSTASRHIVSPMMIAISRVAIAAICTKNTIPGIYVDCLSGVALGGAMIRLVGLPRSIGRVT